MKKIALVSLVLFTISSSCSKTIDSIVSCIIGSAVLNIDVDVDPKNSKQITFKINNSSKDYVTDSVEWDFGDGNKKTSGSSSVTHSYSKSGNYELTAKIKLKKGKDTCATTKEKEIKVKQIKD